MKNVKPSCRCLLVVAVLISGFTIGKEAPAATQLEPRRIVIAVEHSAYTGPYTNSIQAFVRHLLNSVPLGHETALYEFGSRVKPIGFTPSITKSQVFEGASRFQRQPGQDRFVDYKGLALALYAYKDRPTSVVVVCSGQSCLPPGQLSVDPIGPFGKIFPNGEGHVLLFCGVTDALLRERELPENVFLHRIDTDRGFLPEFTS